MTIKEKKKLERLKIAIHNDKVTVLQMTPLQKFNLSKKDREARDQYEKEFDKKDPS